MVGALGSYHVSQVEYILNPPLLKRYHDFKKALQAKGEPVHERLTFHGTSAAAIEAIVREGFRIGGVDTAVLAGKDTRPRPADEAPERLGKRAACNCITIGR